MLPRSEGWKSRGPHCSWKAITFDILNLAREKPLEIYGNAETGARPCVPRDRRGWGTPKRFLWAEEIFPFIWLPRPLSGTPKSSIEKYFARAHLPQRALNFYRSSRLSLSFLFFYFSAILQRAFLKPRDQRRLGYTSEKRQILYARKLL